MDERARRLGEYEAVARRKIERLIAVLIEFETLTRPEEISQSVCRKFGIEEASIVCEHNVQSTWVRLTPEDYIDYDPLDGGFSWMYEVRGGEYTAIVGFGETLLEGDNYVYQIGEAKIALRQSPAILRLNLHAAFGWWCRRRSG